MRGRLSILVLGAALGVLTSCSFSIGWSGISVGGYSFDREGVTAERCRSGEVPAGTRAVVVDNQFGNVVVEATRGETGWVWDLKCWATTQAEADRLMDEIRPVVEQDGAAARWALVMPEPPIPELRGIESNLTIKVPRAVAVDLHNSHGSTRLSGTEGDASLECRHCDLELTDLGGKVAVSNAHGDINARSFAGGRISNRHGAVTAREVEGDLEIESGHGAVEVRHAAGGLTVRNEHGGIIATGVRGRLDLATSFSAIYVESPAFEITGSTRHGDMTVKLTGDATRIVDLRGSFGTVTVELPPGVTPRIEAATSYARIRCPWASEGRWHHPSVTAGPEDARLRVRLSNRHGDIVVR